MDEAPKQSKLERTAWIMVSAWILVFRIALGSRGSGLAIMFGLVTVVTCITTWIGWCCGMICGSGGKGAFYGLASGLLVATLLCAAIVVAIAQQGQF